MLLFGSKKRPLTYRLPSHNPGRIRFTEDQKEFLLGSAPPPPLAGYLHFPAMWNDQMAGFSEAAKAKALRPPLIPNSCCFPSARPGWSRPGEYCGIPTSYARREEAREITLETGSAKGAELLHSMGAGIITIKQGAKGFHPLIIMEIPSSCQPFVIPEEEIRELNWCRGRLRYRHDLWFFARLAA